MPRIHQDVEFEVGEVAGRVILRLCGLVDHDAPDDSPIVVFARFEGPLEWHRCFLDAGAAFWETWSDEDVAAEFDDDSVRLVDYFAPFLPRTLVAARAFEPALECASRILLEFVGGVHVDVFAEDDIPDAPTRIRVVSDAAGGAS